MVRRALDEKRKGLLQYGTPLSITFKDAKEFDIRNPIIGGLLSQAEANKLDDNILKQKLEDLKNREIESRLIGLRLPSSKNNNNNNNGDDGDIGGFGNMDFRGGKPSFLPPQRTAVLVKEKCVNDLLPSTSRTSRQKTDDLIRRFNELKKPIFRDEPLKLQSQLTDPVIVSIFDNLFFAPPHSPVEDVLKPDLKPPLTNFNKDTNIIEMIPKTIKNEPDDKIMLSDQLSKLFPQDNDEGKIPEHEGENIASLPIDKSVEIITKTGKGQIPEVLEFFSRGKNKSFDQKVKMLGLSSNFLNFLDFLQSAECEEILVQNKLKIHVESGNIFHNNIDNNESIYRFFQQQGDSSKAFINFDFIFRDYYCYSDYFE